MWRRFWFAKDGLPPNDSQRMELGYSLPPRASPALCGTSAGVAAAFTSREVPGLAADGTDAETLGREAEAVTAADAPTGVSVERAERSPASVVAAGAQESNLADETRAGAATAECPEPTVATNPLDAWSTTVLALSGVRGRSANSKARATAARIPLPKRSASQRRFEGFVSVRLNSS